MAVLDAALIGGFDFEEGSGLAGVQQREEVFGDGGICGEAGFEDIALEEDGDFLVRIAEAGAAAFAVALGEGLVGHGEGAAAEGVLDGFEFDLGGGDEGGEFAAAGDEGGSGEVIVHGGLKSED